jgi:hypothetical protein
MHPVRHQECGQRRRTDYDSQHRLLPPAAQRASGAPQLAAACRLAVNTWWRGASPTRTGRRAGLHGDPRVQS